MLDFIRSQLRSTDTPFGLLILLDLHPAKLTAFTDTAHVTAKATLAEAGGGCLNYEFSTDSARPGRVVLYEKWANFAALQRHFAEAHTAAILKATGEASADPTQPPQVTVLRPL